MKKILFITIGLLLGLAITVNAASVFQPFQGGTGTSTAPSLGTLLIGNSSNVYRLLGIGSTGNILMVNGGTASWVATSSLGIISGIQSLNGQTGSSQTFATTSTNGGFGFSSGSNVHTFNLPYSSSAVSGILSGPDWTSFNTRVSTSGVNTIISASTTIAHPGDASTGNVISWNGSNWVASATSTLGFGNVTGPATSTDNAITRFDGTTGKIVQNSGVTISDTSVLSGLNLSDGSLVFATSTGTLSQDNANLYWDDGNNRLGIGTTIPQTSLEVGGTTTTFAIQGSTTASGNLILRSTSDATRGRIYLEGTSNTTGSGITVTNNSGTAAVTFFSGSSGNQALINAAGMTAGFFRGSNSCSSAPCFSLDPTTLQLASSFTLGWGPTSYNSTKDIGLARLSPGVLRITNGSSGGGSIQAESYVATSTSVASTFAYRVGIATTTPVKQLDVYNSTATSTIYVHTGTTLPGSIILEDTDAAGCTEITTLNGVISGAIVTCP